jgi:hypothetical protein
MNLHGDCELHQRDACGPAVWTVSVPTDATHTADAEINVGEDCTADAQRWLEGQDFATGAAQIDPLHYLGGAA